MLAPARPVPSKLQVAAASLAAWVAVERGRFALWLPVGMTAGSVAYFSWGEEPWRWLGTVVALLAACVSVALRQWAAWRGVAALVAALGVGFASAQWAAARAPPLLDVPRTAVVVTGTVRAVEALPQGRRVTLQSPALGEAVPSMPEK